LIAHHSPMVHAGGPVAATLPGHPSGLSRSSPLLHDIPPRAGFPCCDPDPASVRSPSHVLPSPIPGGSGDVNPASGSAALKGAGA
jgi:hypothetical protein